MDNPLPPGSSCSPYNSSALGLFEVHRTALVNYAGSLTGDRAEAEDLVQEAWLRFNQAAQKGAVNDAKSYLFRIVRNLAFDSLRKLSREQGVIASGVYDDATEFYADETPTAERVAISKSEIQCVAEALKELPERTRIAFEMHRFGGAKLKEIGAYLGISSSMAQILVTDAAEHCKACLRKLR